MAGCPSEGQGETAVKGPDHSCGAFQGGGPAPGTHSACGGSPFREVRFPLRSRGARWAVSVCPCACTPRARLHGLCWGHCSSSATNQWKQYGNPAAKSLQSAPRAARAKRPWAYAGPPSLRVPGSQPCPCTASPLPFAGSPWRSQAPRCIVPRTMVGRAEKGRGEGEGLDSVTATESYKAAEKR